MANKNARKTEGSLRRSYSSSVFSQLRLGESYTSLFLGVVVVVVVLGLLFSFLRTRTDQNTTSTQTVNEESQVITVPGTYVVKEGETLWSIAERAYGSGYNWVDIAKANNLQNPDQVEAGTKLTLVKAERIISEAPVEITQSITGTTYTVVEGDNLWDISVRSYGDGFKWVEIAKVNKIANPDLIYPGQKINLSR